MTVTIVGISQLKKDFVNYILGLESGENIIITRYGRDIARIVPITDFIGSKLQSAVHAGLADWNGRKVNPGTLAVVNHSNTPISGLVSRDRDFNGEP